MIDDPPYHSHYPWERRVLLYGDGNINIIDGSTIWLVSMAQVLARIELPRHAAV